MSVPSGKPGQMGDVPSDALNFLRQQERAHGVYHVEFRLDRGEQRLDEILDLWFGGTQWRKDGHTLSLIGTDWSGGMFCRWHYPDLAGRSAPIVYVGSEGQATEVIALDDRAFVELLATGRIWGHSDDGTFEDDDQPPAHALFAREARARFGFRERTAEEIQREGAAAHPDFRQWVQRHSQ